MTSKPTNGAAPSAPSPSAPSLTARSAPATGNGKIAPALAQRDASAARPPQRTAPPRAPAAPHNLDETIAKAQHGKVNIAPAKAIAMAGKLYSTGQYGPAEKVCRQIIAARPANADAHNILGVVLNAQGRPKDAVTALRRAIKLMPTAASFHANLGEILRQNDRADEARVALAGALRIDPANAQAHNNLGILDYDKKEYDSAIVHYRAALASRGDMAEAHNNLGNALRMAGDREGAAAAYQDALMRRETYPEAYNNLGTLLFQDKRHEEAEHSLKKAILQSPSYVEAHNNLANVYAAQRKEVDALRVLGDALKIAPTNPQTLLITARIQSRRGNYEAAEQAARIVLQNDPEHVEAKTALGQVFHETDRFDEAVKMLEQAMIDGGDNPEARNFYGVALKSVGRLDEARTQILKAIELNGELFGAYANLNDLIDFKDRPDLIVQMEAALDAAEDREADHLLPLHFAYAKALDDRGEHARALDHYVTGGRLKRAQLHYVEADTFAFFDGIRAAFPASLFGDRPTAGNDDPRPVFIVGMPRSGSTLVEQILASHPGVHGAGEVKYLSRALAQARDRFPSLPRYPQMMERISAGQLDLVGKSYLDQLTAQSGSAARVTDKLLTNYFFVGLIHLLFPKARIINTMRDPIDTCLSAFTKLFKDDMPHSYDLDELGRYYGKYRQLMEHWNAVLPAGVMTTIRYEDMVANTESEAKRLIEFLGLEWNDSCLDFHNSDRPVKTASVAQVRKPIYKSAVQRWKKYGPGLDPLARAIETPVAS